MNFSKLIPIVCLLSLSCQSNRPVNSTEPGNNSDPKFSQIYIGAKAAFETLSTLSHSLYDGNGSWGENQFQGLSKTKGKVVPAAPAKAGHKELSSDLNGAFSTICC